MNYENNIEKFNEIKDRRNFLYSEFFINKQIENIHLSKDAFIDYLVDKVITLEECGGCPHKLDELDPLETNYRGF